MNCLNSSSVDGGAEVGAGAGTGAGPGPGSTEPGVAEPVSLGAATPYAMAPLGAEGSSGSLGAVEPRGGFLRRLSIFGAERISEPF